MPLLPTEPPRIVDPLTDFAFKRLLGTEESAPLLVGFLNAILPRRDESRTRRD